MVSTPAPLDEMPDDLPDDLRQVAWRAVSAFYQNHAPHFPTALRVNAWHEDAQQEAELAVWIAVQRYDPAVGVSQAVFCYLCAMRALAKAFRKEAAWYGHICALVEVDVETGEEREREIADPGAEEAIWDYVLCQSVREALEELSAWERDLVEWHYGLERAGDSGAVGFEQDVGASAISADKGAFTGEVGGRVGAVGVPKMGGVGSYGQMGKIETIAPLRRKRMMYGKLVLVMLKTTLFTFLAFHPDDGRVDTDFFDTDFFYVSGRRASTYYPLRVKGYIEGEKRIILEIGGPYLTESNDGIADPMAFARCFYEDPTLDVWVGAYVEIFSGSGRFVFTSPSDFRYTKEGTDFLLVFNIDKRLECGNSANLAARVVVVIDGVGQDPKVVVGETPLEVLDEGTFDSSQYVETLRACVPCDDRRRPCRFVLEGQTCSSNRDSSYTPSCSSGPVIGFLSGRAKVNAHTFCVSGSGYGVDQCLFGSVDLSVATSVAGFIKYTHVSEVRCPPHDATFDGMVEAHIRCEVRREATLGNDTAIAAAAAKMEYKLFSGECKDEMTKFTVGTQVGHPGKFSFGYPFNLNVRWDPGVDYDVEDDRDIIVVAGCKAQHILLTYANNVKVAIRCSAISNYSRAQACLNGNALGYLKGRCDYASGSYNFDSADLACCVADRVECNLRR